MYLCTIDIQNQRFYHFTLAFKTSKQKLDTDLDKCTQVIDFKCCRCIENPRVGGSIPPLGTTFTNKNNGLAKRNAR